MLSEKHLMICISGYSGSGKDECAKHLVQTHGALQTGLADPAKRHMADIYGFDFDQLFGPSASRNAGDLRYPKASFHKVDLHPYDGSFPPELGCSELLDRSKKYWCYEARKDSSPSIDKPRPYLSTRLGNAIILVPEGDPFFWLSPRESLQKYCELMNDLYLYTWVRKGIAIHKKLASRTLSSDGSKHMATPFYIYDRMKGLVDFHDVHKGTVDYDVVSDGFVTTCFSDFRHIHEIESAKESRDDKTTPILVRVKRPSVPNPPFNHRSETEQEGIPDSAFHFIIQNDDTIEMLGKRVARMVESVKQSGIPSGTMYLG